MALLCLFVNSVFQEEAYLTDILVLVAETDNPVKLTVWTHPARPSTGGPQREGGDFLRVVEKRDNLELCRENFANWWIAKY